MGTDTPTVDTMKQQFLEAGFGKYHGHLLFEQLLDLPVTVDMLVGDQWESVRKVVAGLKELHGDRLMFEFGGYSEPRLTVRVWKSDGDLRAAWPEYLATKSAGGAS